MKPHRNNTSANQSESAERRAGTPDDQDRGGEPSQQPRRAPFGKATLLDQDVEIDFQQQTTPDDVVTVIATQPLTANETWNKIAPGEFALFHLGERQL